jgi:predicted NUDIX family NTP pyrophosphohydrolase
MYRFYGGQLQVFLVHLGGPYWAKKDDGAWSVPKGEYSDPEDPLSAARREFKEETGMEPSGPFISLSEIRQASGKVNAFWAFEGDLDPAQLRSNTFEMEWPPRSGKRQKFPEVDRGAWFSIETARAKILRAQLPLLDEFVRAISQR